MMQENNQETVINIAISAGYDLLGQQQYVQLLIDAADFVVQMPPEKASELAEMLLNATGDARIAGIVAKETGETVGSPHELPAQVHVASHSLRQTEDALSVLLAYIKSRAIDDEPGHAAASAYKWLASHLRELDTHRKERDNRCRSLEKEVAFWREATLIRLENEQHDDEQPETAKGEA